MSEYQAYYFYTSLSIYEEIMKLIFHVKWSPNILFPKAKNGFVNKYEKFTYRIFKISIEKRNIDIHRDLNITLFRLFDIIRIGYILKY